MKFPTNFSVISVVVIGTKNGPGSSVVIATDYELEDPGIESWCDQIFRTCPDRRWGPAFCTMGTGSFPGGKVRPRRAADYSPPPIAAIMEGYSCTSTHSMGHNRACNRNTLTF